MCYIHYVGAESTKALGVIHSVSWKSAYKGIIPDEILDGITPEKREKYLKKPSEKPYSLGG